MNKLYFVFYISFLVISCSLDNFDLKPNYSWKHQKGYVTYNVHPDAQKSIDQLLNEKSCRLYHDEANGVIIGLPNNERGALTQYTFKRIYRDEDDGGMKVQNFMEKDSEEQILEFKDKFEKESFEPLDEVYYNSIDSSNENTKQNLIVVSIDEESANTDPKFDPQAFNTFLISPRIERGDTLKIVHLDNFEVAKALKNHSNPLIKDNWCYICKHILKIKNTDIRKVDKDINIEMSSNKPIFSDTEKQIFNQELNKLLARDDLIRQKDETYEEFERSFAPLGGIEKILVFKVGFSAMVVVKTKSGEVKVISKDIRPGVEKVDIE